MRLPLRNTLALLAVTIALASSVAPASADGWGQGGWGQGGWGHGGWGHGGWGYGRGGYGYAGGWNNGGVAAAAVLGGLALGAVAGAASQAGYGYGGCYPVQTPVLDAWGNLVAYRQTQVCQ